MAESSTVISWTDDEFEVLLDALETAYYSWGAPGARGTDELVPIMLTLGLEFEDE